jgi:Copper transport outer membrane protein, MctB
VVVIEAPGASGQVVSGIDQALTEADAIISGHIQIQSRFFDVSPATQEQLTQLAQQFAPAGVTLHGSPVAQASEVLADAILTRDGPAQPVAGETDSASAALLSGFGAGGFLTRTGHPEARATLAVVVTPDNPSTTSDSNPASQRLVTLAQAVNLVGQGTVMAGSVSGSGPGSAIDVMRTGSRGGRSRISTVDDADHTIGQIVVAQALYEQLRGISGSYGSTSTASAPGPSPAPTPAPTPSASLPASDGRPSPHGAAATARAGKS